jgi:hypothetical protein
MRVTAHVYPSSKGNSRRSEATSLDIPCGTGEQLVRWLGHFACLKLAYYKRDIMSKFVPHAVLARDGSVLDADHVMKEVRPISSHPRGDTDKLSASASSEGPIRIAYFALYRLSKMGMKFLWNMELGPIP